MKTVNYLQEKWRQLRRKLFQNTGSKSEKTLQHVKGKSTDEDTFLFI